MGAYLAGLPECVMNYQTEERFAKKTLTLIYNGSQSGGVAKENMMWRGIAFLALIDALELTNRYKLNVYHVIRSHGGCVPLNIITRLKETSHPYDPQALGFAMANPAMLRRLMFGFYNTLPRGDQQLYHVECPGYGTPSTLRSLPLEIEGTPGELATDCSLLGDMRNTTIRNEKDAVVWIQQQLKSLSLDCVEAQAK